MSAEWDFEEELNLLLPEWESLGIDTKLIRDRLEADGAIETAKYYVHSPTGGFGEAYRRLRPGATFEGLAVRYADLADIDADTLDEAKAKLAEAAKANAGDAAWLRDAEGLSAGLELQDPFDESTS